MRTLDALGLACELIAHDTVTRNGNGAVAALLEMRLADTARVGAGAL